MKLASRFFLLAAFGCSAGFGQVTNPLGGLVEGYKDAIRLRMERDGVRALNEESAARAAAIRAHTERSQQAPTAGAVLRENLDASDWTAGMFNGRGWRKLEHTVKIGFAVGYDNALFSFGEKGPDRFPPATYGEIVTAMDRFYEKPENAALPIMMGLRAFTMKLKGSSDSMVETEMAAARKMVYDWMETEAKKSSAPPKP